MPIHARKMAPDPHLLDTVAQAGSQVAIALIVHYIYTMALENLDQRIGARIRAERQARAWSLTELAVRASVSRAMIHKIERGDSSPTAQLLGKLSGAFGLSMSTLLARAETNQGRLLQQADQPIWIDPATGYIRRHVSPRSASPLEVIHITLPANQQVPMPASSFAFLRQLVWVLEGELIFTEGTLRHAMQAGDCLELGPPMDCIFHNDTEQPCRYAVILLTTGPTHPLALRHR